MFIESFKVESPNVKYTENEIHSVYNYDTTELVHENRNGTYQWIVKPKTVKYEFKTDIHVPKLGFASKSSSVFLFLEKKKRKKDIFKICFLPIFLCQPCHFEFPFHFFASEFRIHKSLSFTFVGLCLWDGEETTVQLSPLV